MPNYDIQCNDCDNVFEVFCKISERNDVKECPNCNSLETEQKPSAPRIGDAVRLGITKPDNGFKEVLQKIHSRTPGSVLNRNF